ncbi:MAG: hypothetical protein QM638_05085 [Nocardioides sp.]|uniref:hypothetical protein n=1 Tax=Nocardioides sp. TaxID=35761 RepID=UPI0039E40DCC
MQVGMYSGPFGYEVYRNATGAYPGVETTYLNADEVTTPDVAQHEAEIDHGISPVITLAYKNGPFTRAEIAEWDTPVRRYFKTFVSGLRTLSKYAAARHNGTRVYFADEHEAQIKINQHKYVFAGYGAAAVPTTEESAAAWNRVMGYVAKAAPQVVRVYWFGGTGANEDSFSSLLDPSLIQMATIDPYRWRHDASSDTPEDLWSGTVDRLEAQPWMRDSHGDLKPWGVTEWGTDASFGDTSNTIFVTQAMQFFRARGAAFAVYFNRVDGNDLTNDFMITDGRQPSTLAAFRAAAD